MVSRSKKNCFKVVIVTTAQPSTNPRMMKEVDALLSKGAAVKVFYSFCTKWANATDKELINSYPMGMFKEVGGNPYTNKFQYIKSRLYYKAAIRLYKLHSTLFNYVVNPNSFDLMRYAVKEKADLYIAHNLGALPAVIEAAKKWNKPCGFDAEDYHRGEYEKQSGRKYEFTKMIEEKYLPKCTYITAASPLIAEAYKNVIPKLNIQVINNVFSNFYLQKFTSKTKKPLSIFWFSQTIGPDRGLENIIYALNKIPHLDISLNLMGNCSKIFKDFLLSIAIKPKDIHFMIPAMPDKIFSIAAQFDIGLASEVPHCENREFC